MTENKFLMTLRLNPEGLTREEIIERLKISDASYANYVSRNESYIARSNGKFLYKNPYEDIGRISGEAFERYSGRDAYNLLAKCLIDLSLISKKQKEKIEEIREEYKKAGGI